MKLWLILLVVVTIAAGIMAFSGMVQAAIGAAKAIFWCAIALLALSAGGYYALKDKASSSS